MADPPPETLPLTKEILGEHLYSKVEATHPDNTAIITGMLLEAGNEQVMAMLEEPNLLAVCIKSALKVLHRKSEDSAGIDHQSLGEELYSLVQDLKPKQCAAKITGMLMEMDISTIQRLLDSPTALQKAVNRAVDTLNADAACNILTKTHNSDEERQDIGEELFNLVSLQHKEYAPKITGMLLELDLDELKTLINKPAALRKKIDLAIGVLEQNQLPTIPTNKDEGIPS